MTTTSRTFSERFCGPKDLLSGVVGLGDVAERVGTPYVLGKPFDMEGLLHLLARALEERTPPRPAPP